MFSTFLCALLFGAVISQNSQSNVCRSPLEIVFVLDGSDSILSEDFARMIAFVGDMLVGLSDSGATMIDYGAVVYSSRIPASGTIPLHRVTSEAEIRLSLQTLPHPKEGTRTDLGIAEALPIFAASTQQDVRQVAVVITDGRSLNRADTLAAADDLKNAGISVVSVGIGTLVDIDELRLMSSDGNPQTVNNFNDLHTLLDTLSQKICPTTTTTTTTTTTPAPTTTTTPAPTTTTTPVPTTPKGICYGCAIENGVGYNVHPTECNMYVHCWQIGSAIYGIYRECPIGLFWNQELLTCVRTCAKDVCIIKSDHTRYRYLGNCQAFWECHAGQSVAQCCPKGTAYNSNTGSCAPDATCADLCAPTMTNPSWQCNRRELFGDNTAFEYYDESTGRWVFTSCGTGNEFVVHRCACLPVTVDPLSAHVCKPEVYLPLFSDFKDYSGNNVSVGVENVELSDGGAYFNGDARLILWRFSNVDFGKQLVIKLRFREYPNLSQNAALITNGDCDNDASVAITVNTDTGVVQHLAEADTAIHTVSQQYSPGDWKDVVYVYDGQNFVSTVNGVSSVLAATDLSVGLGSINRKHCALHIGHGTGYDKFIGYIAEVYVYMCIPDGL